MHRQWGPRLFAMKVLLAYLCHYRDRHDYHISLMPVGLVSIAAYLEKLGHEVILANYSRTGHRKAIREIYAHNPSVLGVSIFTHNRIDSMKLIQGIKKRLPKCVIVAGGPHITFLTDEYLRQYREIDFIIRGEGELAFANLLEMLGRKRPPSTKVLEAVTADPLDALPSPSDFSGEMFDIDPNEQFKYIITTRGCPHQCGFCCSPVFWDNKVRFVKPSRIVSDLVGLYKKRGLIYFSIRDDNFTLRKGRVMDFAQRLRDSGVWMMWNCQSRVDTVDEEMLGAMKLAGMEMVQFGVESGSDKILALYDKKTTVVSIKKAAAAARKVGLYLSIYLMTGMKGEKYSDVKKTAALIRQVLPGDGIVSPVALYPGTRLYEETRLEGGVSNSIWFESTESGIFLRNEEQVFNWMEELLKELSLVREKSWYRTEDFRRHRRVMGPDCWVTDILEGDYNLDEELYEAAERNYLRVISTRPANPWGYLRMGKLKFQLNDFDESERYYREVTRIVPAYYGGWLKLAENRLALGNRHGARQSAAEAWKLNRFDARINNIRELLK